MGIDPGQNGTERGDDSGVQVTVVLGVLPARLMLDVVTDPEQGLTRINVT